MELEPSEPSTTSPESTDDKESTTSGMVPQDTKAVAQKSDDSFDILSKRFAALKKR